MASGAIEILS